MIRFSRYESQTPRELAHEQLTAASTMFREMDMQFWLEKAESALKEL